MAPKPLQNCEIHVEGTIDFRGIDLYDLDAEWTNRRNEAAFKIDFDFQGTQTVARVNIDAEAGAHRASIVGSFSSDSIDISMDATMCGHRNGPRYLDSILRRR